MNNNKSKVLENLSLMSYIGIVMILPILAAVYLGNIIDQRMGTNHVFMILLVILGVATSFLNVYRIVMKDIGKK